jgi:hypothetical protein
VPAAMALWRATLLLRAREREREVEARARMEWSGGHGTAQTALKAQSERGRSMRAPPLATGGQPPCGGHRQGRGGCGTVVGLGQESAAGPRPR